MNNLTLPPIYTPVQYKNLNLSLSFHPYHAPHIYGLPEPHRKYSGQRTKPDAKEIYDADVVYFPEETLLPMGTVDKIIEEEKKRKEKLKEKDLVKLLDNNGNIERKIMLENLEKRKELRNKNKRKWTVLRSGIHMVYLYKTIQQFSKCSIRMRGRKGIDVKLATMDLMQLRNFLLPILGNIERFCLNFFHYVIIYNTNDVEKQLNSVFIVKSFIHQLFSDLTSAFADEEAIPDRIKDIMKRYITEKEKLPYGFLTTFEFNRLEFDTQLRLAKMTKERKGMMVGFILLYRVLICDIFKNPYTYFRRLEGMKPSEKKIERLLRTRLEMIRQGRIQRMSPSPKRKTTKRDSVYYSNNYGQFFGGNNRSLSNQRSRSKKSVRFNLDEDNNNIKTTRNNVSPIVLRNTSRDLSRNNSHRSLSGKRNPNFDDNKKFNRRRQMNRNIPPACPPPNNNSRSNSMKRNRSNRSINRTPNQSNNHSILRSSSRSVSRSHSRNRSYESPISQSRGRSGSSMRNRQNLSMKQMAGTQKLLIEKEERKKLKKKVIHNFNFIINVLHYVFKSSFEESIEIFKDDFKEIFAFRSLVFKGKKYNPKIDDIELVKGIVLDERKTEAFIQSHVRWLQMYKLNTLQLCIDFAKKCYI